MDTVKSRLTDAATSTVPEILSRLGSRLTGLSENAAEKLLAMITTTCTVTRRNQPKMDLPLDEVVPGDIIHLSS